MPESSPIQASHTGPTPAGDDADDPGAAQEPPLSGSGFHVELNWLADQADAVVEGWLIDQLTRIAALAGVQQGNISLAVVGDEQMAELHQQYKNVAGTTDVLSFDLRSPGDSPDTVEADLILCIDEARRQAAQRGHDWRMELLLYAVHGLLHMLDYDDTTDQQARRMHEREDELLTLAGFEPVYRS